MVERAYSRAVGSRNETESPITLIYEKDVFLGYIVSRLERFASTLIPPRAGFLSFCP